MSTVIKVENLSKMYHLGTIGYGTLRDDLAAWWAKVRGKEDPNAKIGQKSRLGQHGEFWALRDIDFEIQQGDRVGIIGRNGAGKSTLLKILSRITAPTTGRIGVKGRIASLLEVGTGFHPELTGRENIYLNGAILGMKRREIQNKFDEIVEFAGVSDFVDTPVKRYSSGMYVRLAFAVAAHLDAEILVVDEVLAVGDAEFQKKAIGRMEEVSTGQGKTVLFVSHNIPMLQRLCQKGCLLKDGQNTSGILAIAESIDKYANKNMVSEVWENLNDFSTEYFVPKKVFVENRYNSDKLFLKVLGELLKSKPDLQIGYSLYDENMNLLFWSAHTDQNPSINAGIKDGLIEFKTAIPNNLLNEGIYTVVVFIALFSKKWILNPDNDIVRVSFSVGIESKKGKMWTEKRPGLLAPSEKWEVKNVL